MTRNKKLQKTSIITTAAVAIALTGIFLLSDEIKFAHAGLGAPPPPPSSICPEDNKVQHWDKIIFKVEGEVAVDDGILSNLIGKTLDLKIIDPPGEIVNLDEEIKSKLQRQGVHPENLAHLTIEIIDVRYETVTCGLRGPEGPPGPQGPMGEKGDSFSTTYVKRTIETLPKDKGEVSVSVSCEEGDAATGGGIRKPYEMNFRANQPTPATTFGTPTGWFAIFDTKVGGQVEVFVVCLGEP